MRAGIGAYIDCEGYRYNFVNWLTLIKWFGDMYIYKEKIGECGRV